VAGEGEKGFRDGSFTSALFDGPSGLALNGDGTLLFVADRRNNRIRVVHLNDNNRVTTLAGLGEAGYRDGTLGQALFDDPTALAFLPGDRLVVNDGGNSLLRLIDLKAKTVVTLAGNIKSDIKDGKALETSVRNLWNMVYDPANDDLYFSQPDYGIVRKLDMKTRQVTTALKDGRLLHPRALCLYQGKLCVADQEGPLVYQVDSFSNTPSAAAVLSEVGNETSRVIALAAWGNYLYAMQTDTKAWIRLQPDKNFVPMSVWGYPANLDAYSNQRGLLLFFPDGDAVGFIADPKEERRFFVASERSESIISLKDYDFWKFRELHDYNAQGLNDFDYPPRKPPHTFRILIAGDSLSFALAGEDAGRWGPGFSRMENMPKRLELELNTIAALNDAPINYEVVDLGRGSDGDPAFLWPYYEVPRIVKKFDIDLVLYLFATVNTNGASVYFSRPINSDGIPAERNDPEYLLKPFKEKIPSGAANDFINAAWKRDGFKPRPTEPNWFFPGATIFFRTRESVMICLR
jgi:DNA-binding beta-propeller fold protein YncE